MNITTHGKDGTRIRFMEAEKRRFRQVYDDLTHLIGIPGDVGQLAHEAKKNLARFMAFNGILDSPKEPPADQHREENTEEHEQKLSGAGKK